MYDEQPQVRELIDTARALEGMPRNASTHAAGVVITERSCGYDYVPLSRNDDQMVTQFTMVTIEELGLLKMDFLGLRNLTVIADAEKTDAAASTPDFSIEDSPDMNDPATYEMLAEKARRWACSSLNRRASPMLCTGLQARRSIEDITAVVALYRPGPMQSIPRYIECRTSPGKGDIQASAARADLERHLRLHDLSGTGHAGVPAALRATRSARRIWSAAQ